MTQHSRPLPTETDVVIVGAGFAGMYLLLRLRRMGFRVVVLEAADGVGGTWYWNRYPGARCDIESIQYSMQFDAELQQEWEWSERYSPQPEILDYANHIADRFDLRGDIWFERRVASAVYEDGWTLTTEAGEMIRAPFCVMATGCLSSVNDPKIAGQESFAGPTYHTGRWPHEGVDFTGQRVGVIGTGSSAIQSIPIIAEQAADLTVFQRTANYAVPAHNQPLDPDFVAGVKARYPEFRAEAKKMFSAFWFPFDPDRKALEATPEALQAEYQSRWDTGGLSFMGAFADLMFSEQANATAAEFVRGKIREIVDDPAVADLLCPTNVIGCKRLCVDTGYYATFNKPHVHLVDVSGTPIERISETAVHANGKAHEIDALVFATGFDAMTGSLLRIDIRGRAGRRLADKWAEGPKSYLGLAIEGFPNLFTVTGPGSPSVLTNMLPSIEQHVEWISDCIAKLREDGIAEIEATPEAEEGWVEHNRDVAGRNLRSTCSSWYVGANVPGKPRVFMPYIGGFPGYVAKCEQVARDGYEGFALGK